MAAPSIDADGFIRLWDQFGGDAKAVANHLGVDVRNVFQRRRRLEKLFSRQLPSRHDTRVHVGSAVVTHRIDNGTILVGSDAHIWPGPLSTMQRAFLHFIPKLKPDTIVANGDFFDGSRISRYPSIGWEDKPTVAQEVQAVQDFLGEVERLRPQAKRFWPLGNHDIRFESDIARKAPEYAKVAGVHLKDHFPNWIPCWRIDVNDDIIIRHRELGGEHADYRNVVTGGKSVVTGHDHRTGVVPVRNYRGLLYGVRCGFMGDSPLDPQFVHYLEAKQPNWHPAFAVLTFRDGLLLMPELVTKIDDTHVQFRGEVIEV